jgi:hypothetical protein
MGCLGDPLKAEMVGPGATADGDQSIRLSSANIGWFQVTATACSCPGVSVGSDDLYPDAARGRKSRIRSATSTESRP